MSYIKPFTLKKALFNIILILPIISFAGISEQDKINFKNLYGNEIKTKTYNNLLDFCERNDSDIDACLMKLKAQTSYQALAQNQIKGNLCCLNVSGFIGDYAFIQGQGYCIPPCHN